MIDFFIQIFVWDWAKCSQHMNPRSLVEEFRNAMMTHCILLTLNYFVPEHFLQSLSKNHLASIAPGDWTAQGSEPYAVFICFYGLQPATCQQQAASLQLPSYALEVEGSQNMRLHMETRWPDVTKTWRGKSQTFVSRRSRSRFCWRNFGNFPSSCVCSRKKSSE